MTDSKSNRLRRAERVLSPEFDRALDQLDVPALRARRRDAEAEEQELSYIRRLLHGRIDILRAELHRRAGHGEEVLDSLPEILADRPGRSPAHGRHVSLEVPDASETPHRAAQLAAASAGGPDLRALTDRELRGVIDTLENHERAVSGSRARVHRVLDHLSKELTRRYRDGTAQVDDLLASVRRP